MGEGCENGQYRANMCCPFHCRQSPLVALICRQISPGCPSMSGHVCGLATIQFQQCKTSIWFQRNLVCKMAAGHIASQTHLARFHILPVHILRLKHCGDRETDWLNGGRVTENTKMAAENKSRYDVT